MKKVISITFCVLLLALTLCACKDSEPLGLVISLDGDGEWILEMEKQGVVDYASDPVKDATTGKTVFIFEAVDEGETELDFYLVQTNGDDISKATRKIKYLITVYSDLLIKSEIISDEEMTKPAVKLTDKNEAETYLTENITASFESTDEYVIKHIETYTENGITWYKFSLSNIITLENGDTVLRLKQMYAINENGEIILIDMTEKVPDEILNLK